MNASALLLIALPAVMVAIPVALPRCSPTQARTVLIAVGALWLATFAVIIARS
ncbi:hypothetical protein BX265_4971 [Streptomyces sp. TLI_235]|nr:hypothetical protein [Streptomyces sp. TLI_235]PBC80135.1 hypothetical protein BX265_4971 [Streptomyces sp. TLI_235]